MSKEEASSRGNEVSSNKEQASTPVVIVSNDCCLPAAALEKKPQISRKSFRKAGSEINVMNLQKAMRKAFEAQELLEVTMEQMSKQMQEMEMKKQNTTQKIETVVQLSELQDDQELSASSDNDTKSEDVVFVKCLKTNEKRSRRERSHDRSNSRGRSRGHSRGHSRSASPVRFNGKHLHRHHHKHHYKMMMHRHGAEQWVFRGVSPHKHYGKHNHKHGKHFMGKCAQWMKGQKHGYRMHENVKCSPCAASH